MAGNVQAVSELLEAEVFHQQDSLSTAVVVSVRDIPSADVYLGELSPNSFSYRFIKRFLDIVLSGTLLVVLAPFILLIAVAVRVSSPGPVLYRERRMGRFGRPFTIYKFRSMFTREYLRTRMRHHEDEKTHMRFRMAKNGISDPRITKVGAILRRLSLDELPQLINILKGEMSLVGPRPVVEAELSNYGDDLPFYNLVYPGLSGLWQVSGRSDITYPARVTLDVMYCKKWSLLFDFAILARTLPAVIRGKGAY